MKSELTANHFFIAPSMIQSVSSQNRQFGGFAPVLVQFHPETLGADLDRKFASGQKN
jgi:hypothetical protein